MTREDKALEVSFETALHCHNFLETEKYCYILVASKDAAPEEWALDAVLIGDGRDIPSRVIAHRILSF